MILNNEKTKCETNMSGGTAFTIAANAKMFKILSSGLYSNKEKAIIREVSCNAFDANVDAGKGDVPIVVHLPNTLEPFFSVKDSGPGLTPEQMVNVYTQYGNSTKTDRNDQIGALGLGSKSPFSYIDSFTVISITEGKKNTYSCYIDGNGEPQLQPFGTEETDECNGVEVTFPVKQEDFSRFRTESEIVFRPFSVRPDVQGSRDYKVKDFDVLLTSGSDEKADWQMVRPHSEYRYTNEHLRVAVQGNIEYPLNLDKIDEYLSPNASKISRENYRLHFNIGELDIAASREELGYDKDTISNIVDKIEKMAEEIQAVQQEKIDSLENKYQAMLYINKIRKSSDIYRNFNFSYLGNDISDSLTFNHKEKIVVSYSKNHRRNITRKQLGDSWASSVTININSNIIWVFNDDGKITKAVTKARSLVDSQKIVYLIQDKEFFDLIPGVDYLNASEIELESVTRITEKGRFFKKYYNSSTYNYQFNDTYSNAESVGLDLNEEFYYMETRGQKPALGIDIYDYYNLAIELGLIANDLIIYGVSAGHTKTKKFKEYKAIEFSSFIKDLFITSSVFDDAVKNLGSYTKYQKIQNEMNSDLLNLIKREELVDTLPKDSLLRIIKDDYLEVKEKINKDNKDLELSRKVKNMASKFDISLEDSEYSKHLDFMKMYPLVNSLSWRYNKEDFIEYIKGQDLLIKMRAIGADSESANEEITKIEEA